jgi:hypothetical protein
VLTVVESVLFARLWPDYWSPEEYGDFILYLAANPLAGDVIPGSGGCRKVRWVRPGVGKRDGVRVIYVLSLVPGVVVLLTIYSKSARDSLSADVLRKLLEAMS